jgi:hypothetical protein
LQKKRGIPSSTILVFSHWLWLPSGESFDKVGKEMGKTKKVIVGIGLTGCLAFSILVILFIAFIIVIIWWITRFGV